MTAVMLHPGDAVDFDTARCSVQCARCSCEIAEGDRFGSVPIPGSYRGLRSAWIVCVHCGTALADEAAARVEALP